jgi:oligoendopeptidase F
VVTPETFKDAPWEEVRPYYRELAERPLDLANAEAWLADWSAFEEALGEAATKAEFACSQDTADAGAEAAQRRFTEEIEPLADEQRVGLQKRLVALGYTRADLEVVLQQFRCDIDLFREANIPLETELSSLATEWNKLSGGLTVRWQGEELTPDALLPFLLENDRSVREQAFRLRAQAHLEKRGEAAAIFDRMHVLRTEVARNAGFANYRDYAHKAMGRFDYTPDDCLHFHEAVEEVAKPAAARILERRARKMGLERLRPWDLAVDAEGRERLRPFADVAMLREHAGAVLGQVDPAFSARYEAMEEAGTLDLENRKDKAPGGYCAPLAWSRVPVIFMNAVGVDEDVRTLLHESGHAMHDFEAFKQPLVFLRETGSEIAEVASMSMELLADPYLDLAKGGYYNAADAARSKATMLEEIILFLPHCAAVDAWQQWAYTAPEGASQEAREAKWLELRGRFEPGVIDWGGLDQERIARWYQQPHFFTDPFYYIEYGIAQMGALQVWRNSLQDKEAAVRAYRSALALGSSASLPKLYAAAGAKMVFDAAGMQELVGLVEAELQALDLGLQTPEDPGVGLA